MAGIGKTIDELPSFTTAPSLSSFFAIRDMSVAASSEEATKKYTIADLIILINAVATGMQVGKVTINANSPQTIDFPIPFSTDIPEVGVLRLLDANGSPILGVVNISNITLTGFDVVATEQVTLTYIVGNVTI